MPCSSASRRPSDFAHDVMKSLIGKITGRYDGLKEEHARRSRSTGDLDLADYTLIDYATTAPSTSTSPPSPLPPHFDDCDRVPMQFKAGSRPKLLPQTEHTMKLMRKGSKCAADSRPGWELHRAQKWFFDELERAKADAILISCGLVDGSFLIRRHNGRFVLSLCYGGGAIGHIHIGTVVEMGDIRFRIGVEKSFSNLCELVDYYRRDKGFVLPQKLKTGVARNIKVEKRSSECPSIPKPNAFF